jgi:hypothetical protein
VCEGKEISLDGASWVELAKKVLSTFSSPVSLELIFGFLYADFAGDLA